MEGDHSVGLTVAGGTYIPYHKNNDNLVISLFLELKVAAEQSASGRKKKLKMPRGQWRLR